MSRMWRSNPDPIYTIGDIVRYDSGSSALMKITHVQPDHGGSVAYYHGRQCMGGAVAAYHQACERASDEDLETWAQQANWRSEKTPAQIAAEVDEFLSEVRDELVRARAKFPGDRIMTIALAEEFGELCKAVLDESAANVRKEAVQTAVMAARVVLDGDGSVQEWRQAKGLDRIGIPVTFEQPDGDGVREDGNG